MKLFGFGRNAVVLGGAVGLISILGCSGANIPKTIPVSGRITYQNKPLEGAEVAFVSEGGDKNVFPARGVTNSSGEFTLSTYVDPQHEVRGATVGVYAVTVTKVETMDQEKMREQFASNPTMEFKKLVPARYTSAKETPLTAKVDAGKTNRFEFTLED